MDPATIPNGCLWFIPGSHHVTRFEPFPITENPLVWSRTRAPTFA